MRSFVEAIEDRLEQTGRKAVSAALAAGLKRDAIRSVLRGRVPSIARAEEICGALGLEFYIGPPRAPVLPPSTDSHRWGDRKGKEVTPYPVPMREGHKPERVGFSPNGCAYYGLDFLLSFDLNPKMCEVIEIFDDSMAPEFPAGAAGLVDLRKTEWVHDRVCALCAPELTVRRTMRTGDCWSVVADNEGFESIPRADGFEIIGQVVWTSHMVGVEAVA